MRLVCVLFTFENNTGRTEGRTHGQTHGLTDTISYKDAMAHLKMGRVLIVLMKPLVAISSVDEQLFLQYYTDVH